MVAARLTQPLAEATGECLKRRVGPKCRVARQIYHLSYTIEVPKGAFEPVGAAFIHSAGRRACKLADYVSFCLVCEMIPS
jgi:hypothetical protein